ncbi:Unknown protein, partial [Striga hermonthica]
KSPLDQQSSKTLSAGSTKALVEFGGQDDAGREAVLGKRSHTEQLEALWKRA